MRLETMIVAVLVLTASASQAGALPPCAGPVEASGLRVVRVEKNGDLVLEDGRAVRPEGLILPAGARDHAPDYLTRQAVAMIDDLTRGRRVTLSVFYPKEDRYGRLRAQVFILDAGGEPWLQMALLRRGLARVSMSPDRHECAEELFGAETQARAKHSGIWATEFYAIRAPDDLDDATGTFQIVEGRALSAAVKNGRGYIDFGEDWRTDFKVTIAPDDMKRFRNAGVDPRTYAGLTLRVRGYVERLGGPEIEIASPADIEVVQGR